MPADPNETPAFNLDELKFLPAWMKEEPGAPPQYREYRDEPERPRRADEYRRPGPPRGDRNRDRDRRSAGPGGHRARPPGSGGGGRDGGFANRGPRVESDRRGNAPRDGRPGDRNGGGCPRHRDERDERGPAPAAPVQPAPVRVEFLPDPRGLASIARQIRASHLAYPLFGMARMFLSRPERHRVRLSADNGGSARKEGNGNGAKTDAASPQRAVTLFQLGEDGPVTLDKAALEKIAFEKFRDQYYSAETIQKDPPKGNFTNVARERLTGTLLGPTNHHAYQTNLRALYDSRFSRRMSFEQYRRGIEVVSDPALVERWKEEARTTTVFTVRPPTGATVPATPAAPEVETQPPSDPPAGATAQPDASASVAESTGASAKASSESSAQAGAEPAPAELAPETSRETPAATPPPVVLSSLAEARQHFRDNYFDALVRSGTAFELPGEVARGLPEPGVVLAIRLAHDREIKYPGGLVQPLRAGLQNTGLHVFKHRKRVVYVSLARPTPFRGGDSAVSETVAAILDAVTKHPLCNRKQLAELVLAQRFGATSATNAFPGNGAPAAPSAEPPAATTEPTKPDAADAPAAQPSESVSEGAAPATVETAPPAAADAAPQDAALAKAKAGLAADLRYLVQAGHIIEFHNGTFDLPLPPKPKEPLPTTATPAAAATAAAGETPAETPAPATPDATAAGNAEPPSAPAPVASPAAAEEAAAPEASHLPATESEVLNVSAPDLIPPDDASPQIEATPPSATETEQHSQPQLPVWEEPPMDPDAAASESDAESAAEKEIPASAPTPAPPPAPASGAADVVTGEGH